MLRKIIWYLVFTHVLTVSSTHIAGCLHSRSSWRGGPHHPRTMLSWTIYGYLIQPINFVLIFFGVPRDFHPKNSTRLGFGAPFCSGRLPGGDGFERRGRGGIC